MAFDIGLKTPNQPNDEIVFAHRDLGLVFDANTRVPAFKKLICDTQYFCSATTLLVNITLKRAHDGSVIRPADSLGPLDQQTVLVDVAKSGDEVMKSVFEDALAIETANRAVTRIVSPNKILPP